MKKYGVIFRSHVFQIHEMLRNVSYFSLLHLNKCCFCSCSFSSGRALLFNDSASGNRNVTVYSSLVASKSYGYANFTFALEPRPLSFIIQSSTSAAFTRHLHLGFSSSDESKVEQQLEIIKDRKKELEKKTIDELSATVTSAPKKEIDSKSDSNTQIAVVQPIYKRVWIKTKKELIHYYTGFKLFFLELRISLKLLRKIMNGDQLTRRERKQLLRTVADIFRLVPFLIFIIIPFMEFFLPVAIKLFPGMLPSTFEEKSAKEKMAKQRFKLKLEMARFLQVSFLYHRVFKFFCKAKGNDWVSP